MITGLIFTLAFILDAIQSIVPVWDPWPASVERAFTLLGQYSYWLNPWIPMKTFWQIMLYDGALFLAFLSFIVFSRAFRLKIFNKN